MAGRWRPKLGQMQALLLAGTAIVLLGVMGLPVLERKAPGHDPAAEARAEYELLRERVETNAQANAGNADASSSREAAAKSDSAKTEPRLSRDLFSYGQLVSRTEPAARASRPAQTAPPAPAPPPERPTLSGILIDGDSRKAVLSGTVVGVGGEVNGYTVISIDSGRVLLKRDEETVTLEVRNEP